MEGGGWRSSLWCACVRVCECVVLLCVVCTLPLFELVKMRMRSLFLRSSSMCRKCRMPERMRFLFRRWGHTRHGRKECACVLCVSGRTYLAEDDVLFDVGAGTQLLLTCTPHTHTYTHLFDVCKGGSLSLCLRVWVHTALNPNWVRHAELASQRTNLQDTHIDTHIWQAGRQTDRQVRMRVPVGVSVGGPSLTSEGHVADHMSICRSWRVARMICTHTHDTR